MYKPMSQFVALFSLITALFLAPSTHGMETSATKLNPSQYLNGVANQLLAEIKVNQKKLVEDTKLAEKIVRSNLLPAIDTYGFAKRTIGKKAWSKATAEQKDRFVNAFIQLVINSYAKGLALYDGQVFNFSDPVMSKSGKFAKVRSSMAQTGTTPIVIDYKLSNKSGSWKIIDLTIEGVSMITSYKSQFAPTLAKLGLEKFIVDLESKS